MYQHSIHFLIQRGESECNIYIRALVAAKEQATSVQTQAAVTVRVRTAGCTSKIEQYHMFEGLVRCQGH
jgi:hypothetical protein